MNEPVRGYGPGSPEKISLKRRLRALSSEAVEIPLRIGGKEVRTGKTETIVMPHDHRHLLADWHMADEGQVRAGMGQRPAHDDRHRAAGEQADEAQPQVLEPDHLVIEREDAAHRAPLSPKGHAQPASLHRLALP